MKKVILVVVVIIGSILFTGATYDRIMIKYIRYQYPNGGAPFELYDELIDVPTYGPGPMAGMPKIEPVK